VSGKQQTAPNGRVVPGAMRARIRVRAHHRGGGGGDPGVEPAEVLP
jgi:hypothetical protein